MADKTTDSDLRVDSIETRVSKHRQNNEKRQTELPKIKWPRIRLPEDTVTRVLIIMIIATLLAAMAGVWFYNRVHLFDSYRIVQSEPVKDVAGTQYAMLGERVIKYGHDGVFCVDTENRSLWSAAYSMQTPISDICGNVMAIAELQGKQVYILNQKGIMGSFETSMNIRKVRVGSGGVTALLLDDGDISWISLCDRNGNQIASVRATLEDSGYPIDLAITPNAKQMMVSSVRTEGNVLTGMVSFYDFSSSSSDRHLMQTMEYTNELFPEVFYTSGRTPAAVGSGCFIVYTNGKRPSEKVNIPLQKEIVSCFHDEDNIGFLYRSDDTEMKYDMDVYSYSGKRTMQTSCSFEYTGVTTAGGEILLYDASGIYVYRSSGRQKLGTSYEKEVRYFASLEGLRKYLVITEDSMDRIRIE